MSIHAILHSRLFLATILIAAFCFPPSAPCQAQATPAAIIPESKEQIRLSFAPLVNRTAPAVVNIYARKLVRQREMALLFDDPIFQHFFGNMLSEGLPKERAENSLGSGVILSGNGLVVTSAHVIEGADEIRIVLADRREFEAKLLTIDKQTDLAVMKVDSKDKNFPYLQLADSDAIEVGDLVIAIGNPFGVGQTVTSGIISAVARTGVGASDLNYFLQTDAAINPGNSGGALVGMDGRVVGINAVIFSRSGGSLGIGFAVPSNMVRAVIDAVEHGQTRVARPWLGIGGQDMTPELSSSLGLERPIGILVNRLHPQSPAAKAGLRVGDIILTLNGRDLEDEKAMRFRIATMPVGGTATFGILRKNAKQEIVFDLAGPPEIPPRDEILLSGENPLRGARIANISPALLEEMEEHEIDEIGVVILSVAPRSPANALGLQRGDRIISINGTPVALSRDLKSLLSQEYEGWQIQVRRANQLFDIILGNRRNALKLKPR
ncbi:MAG: Do family serine endopeptidase [Alphaproteobacteria bacterium]